MGSSSCDVVVKEEDARQAPPFPRPTHPGLQHVQGHGCALKLFFLSEGAWSILLRARGQAVLILGKCRVTEGRWMFVVRQQTCQWQPRPAACGASDVFLHCWSTLRCRSCEIDTITNLRHWLLT